MAREYRLNDAVYLGDGAYARWDGLGLMIYTYDGVQETNRVVLEPEHIVALLSLLQAVDVVGESLLTHLLRHVRKGDEQ